MKSNSDAVEGGSHEILDPATLVLTASGRCIQSLADDGTATPLYQISKDITTTSTRESSLKFERVVKSNDVHDGMGSQHLFYLVHPMNARYRTDLPPYYITAMPGEMMIGNISFETSQTRLQRTEFKALLSARRNTRSQPLLLDDDDDDDDDDGEGGGGGAEVLWRVRPSWKGGGRYKWTDCDGKQVAIEEGRESRRLEVTVPLQREVRDALVAVWALKVWRDTGATRQARREELERMMPPPVRDETGMKMARRTGAMGGVAAGGF